MTLIMGMSKPEGIYMSADYRVTLHPSGKLEDDAALKFLTAKYPPHPDGPTALFGYSGLARLPDKTPTGDWLRETLRGESDVFDASMAHLRDRLNRDAAKMRFPLQITALVVHGDKRYFGGISNLRVTGSSYIVRPDFGYQMQELTEPFMFAHGSGALHVSKADRLLMEQQIGVRPRSPLNHMGLLAAVNRRAAANDQKATVSPFCHACYVNADETTSPQSRTYTERGETALPFSMPYLLFGIDMNDLMRDFVAKTQAMRQGESVELALDADETNKSIRRRP